MLKLLVTELPRTARDCPFSIIDTHPCICKLMLNHEDEYNDIGNAIKCDCVLDRVPRDPCPFLMTMNQYNWVKKR